MPRPEPLPIKVDRITARIISTLSPVRRREIEAKLTGFRRHGYKSSTEVRLDPLDLDNDQVNGVSIKVTPKRVETIVHLKGAMIRNGRQVTVFQDLPLSILASLKKRAANDVIDTPLLEGHSVLYARERDIYLKEEDWVPLESIESTGQDHKPVSFDDFIDRIEQLGITHVDNVMLRYLKKIEKKLHIVQARIEARLQGDLESSITTRIHDLAEYTMGETATFDVKDNHLTFWMVSNSGTARYRNGSFTCDTKRLGYSAEAIERLCYSMPRQRQGHNRRTKNPYRSIEEIRERTTVIGYF